MTMYRTHNMAKRRMALAGCCVYAWKQAATYLPNIRPEGPQEPLIVAAGGHPGVFTMYITVWTFMGFWCLFHMHDGHLLRPISSVAGIAAAWGVAWGYGWFTHPWTDWWLNAVGYLATSTCLVALVLLTPAFPAKIAVEDTDD